jgi:hypothetical protein
MAYTTINKSTDYFNTTLYSGSASTQSVNIGYNLTTDGGMVWLKPRNSADHHRLLDTVRGKDSTLSPNQTATAGDNNNFNAFTSTGFELLSGDSGWNNSGTNYISWNWVAGSGNDTGTSNSDGTITSTVSANTTAGFSIVKYTGNLTSGANIGHGLGVKPSMIIIKNLDAAESWLCYHTSLGATKHIKLNATEAAGTATSRFNDTEPTTSVFTVGNDPQTNGNSNNMIAYCFAEKKGFSKFGLYEGNGNADGAFVYTGFKPSFIIMKEYTNSGQGWCMKTNSLNERVGNPNDYFLKADTNDVENTSTSFQIDMVSNGFKLRNTDGIMNGSGRGFIYMAFAKAPLVGSNNIPATAR